MLYPKYKHVKEVSVKSLLDLELAGSPQNALRWKLELKESLLLFCFRYFENGHCKSTSNGNVVGV